MSNIQVLGKMPDPFMRADGTRVTPAEWPAYREGLRDFVVRHAFGGMPPRPEVVKVDLLTHPWQSDKRCYRVSAGTKERQTDFLLMIFLSEEQRARMVKDKEAKYPVLLTGDGCYANCESDTHALAQKKGFVVATFNRLDIADDNPERHREGGIYEVYPEEKDFTAISAWAWGYSVVMDAFAQIPFIDVENVGITGHSRGGKTVMLAAAVDERIRFVCANNSGVHGCCSHRYTLNGLGDNGNSRTERLRDLLGSFPHWIGKETAEYIDREQDLPYDMHYFGALVAPRYYLQCEGMQDYWINPNGARQNFMAVKACYRYLGCEDHAAAWFRPGEHRQKLPDFEQFIDFMYRVIHNLPLAEHLQIDPYPNEPLIFDF